MVQGTFSEQQDVQWWWDTMSFDPYALRSKHTGHVLC